MFVYKPYDHFFAGDFNIIENVALLDLMKKDLTFEKFLFLINITLQMIC